MGDRPTIYLTNVASRKPPHRGPGRCWTIMARPRPAFGESGEGVCGHLVPNEDHLLAYKAGDLPLETYRRHYLGRLRIARDALKPGHLCAMSVRRGEFSLSAGTHLIKDGDTLICCCSRATAARGECHRVWAAEALQLAGWQVVLDGALLGTSETYAVGDRVQLRAHVPSPCGTGTRIATVQEICTAEEAHDDESWAVVVFGGDKPLSFNARFSEIEPLEAL